MVQTAHISPNIDISIRYQDLTAMSYHRFGRNTYAEEVRGKGGMFYLYG